MVVGAQNLCAIEASTTRVERRPPCCDAKVMMMKGERGEALDGVDMAYNKKKQTSYHSGLGETHTHIKLKTQAEKRTRRNRD